MIHGALFLSRTEEWGTPPDLFAALNSEFGFTVDAAASAENAKLPRYFDKAANGLRQSWAGERVFLNPPFGRGVEAWIRKAYLSWERDGALVVIILPVRTDTKWWHDFIEPGRIRGTIEVRFIRGRLAYMTSEGAGANKAPFPSCVVVMRGPVVQAGGEA